MERIYIVEDDESIREMLAYALKSGGFEVQSFADGGEFFDKMRNLTASLVLLDIMLPGQDGISILKKLRDAGQQVPVIMLTAKGQEMDRIRGLDLGADDYITKPFSVLEVISRIKAVLRRAGSKGGGEIKIGGLTLNSAKRQVLENGRQVELTYKEFELLNYMMLNTGIVLSRDKLLSEIWGFDYGGESRTVDMHIKTLRQKLGESGSIIKTVRNVGYKIGD